MIVNRCANCMSEIPSYPCAHCGYGGLHDHELEYALMPGRILNGKYLVGRVLGQGGFGITYIGFDLMLERKVAIKEYFPIKAAGRQGTTSSVLSWTSGEQTAGIRQVGLQSVLTEARKMAKLEAIPQVITVREAFEENNTAYIVMDFAEGETLKNRVLRTGPISWEEAKKLFLPIVEAMEKVHQAGLVHRDISPDNLMISPNGTMKLLDLGAAKDIAGGQNGPSEEVVKNGFSPFEQYTQRGSAGPWSDVYALAATILFGLTGKVPPSALERVSNDTLDWNVPELKAVPKGVRLALRHAMMVQMKDRTQSMAGFAQGLQKKVVIPAFKKKWIPVAASAAVVALVCLLLLPGLFGEEKASAADTSVSAGSSKSSLSTDDYRLTQIICHPVDGEQYLYYQATFEGENRETNTIYYPDGIVRSTHEYTYDGNDEVQTSFDAYYDEFGEMEYTYEKHYQADRSSREECTYYTDGDISGKTVALYNERNDKIQSDYQGYSYGEPDDYSSSNTYTLEYDERDNLISSKSGDETDGSEERHTYTYDKDGNILSDISEYTYWYSSGNQSTSTSEYYYRYDKNGEMIQWRFVPDPSNDYYDYQENVIDYERYPDGRIKTRKENYDGVLKEVYEYVWEK